MKLDFTSLTWTTSLTSERELRRVVVALRWHICFSQICVYKALFGVNFGTLTHERLLFTMVFVLFLRDIGC